MVVSGLKPKAGEQNRLFGQTRQARVPSSPAERGEQGLPSCSPAKARSTARLRLRPGGTLELRAGSSDHPQLRGSAQPRTPLDSVLAPCVSNHRSSTPKAPGDSANPQCMHKCMHNCIVCTCLRVSAAQEAWEQPPWSLFLSMHRVTKGRLPGTPHLPRASEGESVGW